MLDYPLVERQWRAFKDAQKNLAKIAFAAGAHTVITGHDPPLMMKSEADIARVDEMPYEPCRVAVFSAPSPPAPFFTAFSIAAAALPRSSSVITG